MCWGHHEGCKKHIWLRWILGIAILVFVFSMGVKLGELKALFNGDRGYGNRDYGYKMMRGGYLNEYPQQNYGYGMMYRVQQNQVVPPTQQPTQPVQGQ